MVSEPLKFMADSMLGRLARWLRILGYDVVYDLVEKAKESVWRVDNR
jgi:uncharacterized protein with PIN domain